MKTNNKRRDFIKKSALATGAGMIAPSFTFGTTHSKNTMRETVGHGNFKYTVDKEWGVQDPTKIPVNDCHEMVLDSKGPVSYTHLRAHETVLDLVCRLLLEKKKKQK